MASKKRNVMPCYFETQPGGCRKPHCPYLHERPKEPLDDQLQRMMERPTGGTIIVNKAKMGELGHLILPAVPAPAHSPERRVSAKSRLGPSEPDLRSRLGGSRVERIELIEYSGDDEDMNSEEEALRASAIKTLDLRKRLAGSAAPQDSLRSPGDGQDHASGDEEEAVPEERKVKSVVVKKLKKAKKEKKEKKKKKDKEKKVKKAALEKAVEALEDDAA